MMPLGPPAGHRQDQRINHHRLMLPPAGATPCVHLTQLVLHHRIFLYRLKSAPPSSLLFALKVVDVRNDDPSRVSHVLTESRVLSSLDHLFVPTLYTQLNAGQYTCLLMEPSACRESPRSHQTSALDNHLER
jgi:hypothetical protein